MHQYSGSTIEEALQQATAELGRDITVVRARRVTSKRTLGFGSKVRYEVGVARYEDLVKGQMLGDDAGFLKVLFDPGSLQVLGVHIVGTGAAELIHIGQALMATGGTLGVWRDAAFNHPTLAEAYKVAALNGFNRLSGGLG